jgi:hypothetical protein
MVIKKICLQKLHFKVPDMLPKAGFIGTNTNGIKARVWIMPNNKNVRMLEDTLTSLIPLKDPFLALAVSILQQIEAKNWHKYKLKHRLKASIQTWLARQKEPGTPLRLANTQQFFQPIRKILDYLQTGLKICFQKTTLLKTNFYQNSLHSTLFFQSTNNEQFE